MPNICHWTITSCRLITTFQSNTFQCRHRQLDSGQARCCNSIFKNAGFVLKASTSPYLNADNNSTQLHKGLAVQCLESTIPFITFIPLLSDCTALCYSSITYKTRSCCDWMFNVERLIHLLSTSCLDL